jgi:chorismate mutase
MTLKVKSYKKQIADAVFQLLNDIETYNQKGSVDISNRILYGN